MRQLRWLILFFSAGFVLAADEVRTWTDTQGRKMQAQFIREVDGDVTFLKDGKLIQVGTPREILHSPADEYVDRFVQRRAAVV